MRPQFSTRYFLMVMATILSFVMASPGQDTIKIETNLVRVPVVVLDRSGRYIPNLTKADFHILEDGKPQEIEQFSPVDEPITVYLMLDTSGSMTRFMGELARSTSTFLNTLRPNDHVFLSIFADTQVIVLTDEIVGNLLRAKKVIAIRPLDSKATYVYDAVDEAIKQFANINDRKAIVLFTDALSENRMASARENFHDAEEQDALIYTVRYGDLTLRPEWISARYAQQTKHSTLLDQTRVEDIVPTWDIVATGNGKLTVKELEAKTKRIKGYMDSLAAKTGGRSFEIDKIENLAAVFQQITLELRRTYTLSYYSNSDLGPERRKLEVKVDVPDVAVRAKREIVIPQAKPAQTH